MWGAFDAKVISDSMVKLLELTGNGVLVTHSQGGIVGWGVDMQSDKVKTIVSFEPGNFPFPEDEMSPTITSKFGDIKLAVTSKADFEKLTKMPIVIYFGDFIGDKPSDNQGKDQWRIRLSLAKQWAEVVNKHGGNVEVAELLKVGIKGNTHFMMSDTNNVEVAAHLEGWLKDKGLDK